MTGLKNEHVFESWPMLVAAGYIEYDESGPPVLDKPQASRKAPPKERSPLDKLFQEVTGKSYYQLTKANQRRITETIEATSVEHLARELLKARESRDATKRTIAYICQQACLAVSGQAFADRQRAEREGLDDVPGDFCA